MCIPSVSVSVSPSNLGQETRITRPHTDEIIPSFAALRTELCDYELSEILSMYYFKNKFSF